MYKFLPSKISPKRAITIVVHGLNNPPFVMMKLGQFLSQYGSDVVLVGLTGHQNDYEKLKTATPENLINDIKEAYDFAQQFRSKENGIPLHFVGFSLGGLTNLAFLAAFPEATYDKMLLFAPANTLRWKATLLKKMFFLGDKMLIPSFGIKKYKSYKVMPLKIYKTLIGLKEQLEKANYRNTNQKTLLIIDPKDEVVSYEQHTQNICKYALDNWEIYPLKSEFIVKYHHLIISKETMGERNWNPLTVKMVQFLALN